MIVPAMTYEEMLVDARNDIPSLLNRCYNPTRQLRKAHIGNRKKTISSTFEWTSPRSNNWIITIHYNKRKPLVHCMVWYYDKKGRIAAMVCSNSGSALAISPHVIERYGERYDPITDPRKRLLAFFKDNAVYSFDSVEELKPELWEMRICMKTGLGLGVWQEGSEIIDMRTFISRPMMYREQRQHMQELDRERLFYSMTPGQIAEFMKDYQGLKKNRAA